MREIYLDNAATTKPLAELADVYAEYADVLYYNPSALYSAAVRCDKKIHDAKQILLNAFGASDHKCIFTSCGSESANTVILHGFKQKKNVNFVCALAEHPCVEESYRELERRGYPVTFIAPDRQGYMDAEKIAQAVDENTALVSVMHVNNETGAKNDIERIARMVKSINPNALFHSDGVQAFCKEKTADTSLIDYYTVSAHKLHAHKGTGAVFYKNGTPLKPLVLGGGQEGGLRSGTQNMLGILSFAKAAEIVTRNTDTRIFKELKDIFWEECSKDPRIKLMSPMEPERACNHIVNISVGGINAETLLHMLEAQGIYISTGSACSSKKGKSRIQKALQLSQEDAAGSIRVSFSIFTSKDDAVQAARSIIKNAEQLRKYTRK